MKFKIGEYYLVESSLVEIISGKKPDSIYVEIIDTPRYNNVRHNVKRHNVKILTGPMAGRTYFMEVDDNYWSPATREKIVAHQLEN